ncbi:MAG: NAD-dependent dehydratase [Candidatus Brocadia sp. WS118]|nr:MAG: NAD-dependent dehydratase [Candidatus Brocadia sp. WS118]
MSSSQLAGQKIFITGASGFIGSQLCRTLCNSGAEVYGISRKIPCEKEYILRWRQGDLKDIGLIRNLLSDIKPEVIFHLASHVTGSRSLENVLPTFHSNFYATVNILTAATEAGCRRIILAGSLEEAESDGTEVVPCSPYAAAKWASSAYARMFHALYKTPAVIARLFMVYGPGQQDLNKLIPYVTLSLLQNQSPKLSSGMRQVDWIYVEDVVDGLIALAQAKNVEGCTVDLGSGRLVPIRTVVEITANLINSRGKPLFGAISDRPMEQVKVARTEKTYSLIGWKPKISLERGLEYTVNWYKRQLDKIVKDIVSHG